MSVRHPGRVWRSLFRVPIRLYDWNVGWLLGRRFCRLTHVGRRSGRTYRTVLEVIGTDDATGVVFVVSGYGPMSDWYRNLRANGHAEVEIGRRSFVARHRELELDEADLVFAAYERGYGPLRPLLRIFLTRLLGWRYDGRELARRRLVEQLPIVAFEPVRQA